MNLTQSQERTWILRLRGVRKVRAKAGVLFRLVVPALDIVQGAFVGIIGPSGCGKSTLMDVLGLISTPDAAEGLEFSGGHEVVRNLHCQPESALAGLRRRSLGYVLQTGGLLPFLSVLGNLELPRQLAGLPPDAAWLNTLATRLGIPDQLAKKPHQLSGGQRQRAAIARALSHQPAILLADEPTGAVDKVAALEICALLRDLARERGTTVLMITHDESLVAGFATCGIRFSVTRPRSSETESLVLMDPAPAMPDGIPTRALDQLGV